MALQVKNFNSSSHNDYVIQVHLEELSISTENNTSEIKYSIGIINYNEHPLSNVKVTYVLKLNDITVESGTTTISLQPNVGRALVYDKTTIVTHKSDGGLNMPIVLSIETNDQNHTLPEGTFKWTWELTRTRGSVHIHNGTGYEPYGVYIHDGTKFDAYAAYIHNGKNWELYG